MNIKTILEEYLSSFKAYGKHIVKIFKNPTKEEMDSIKDFKETRFIATSKPKAVYFFNPNCGHIRAAVFLKIPHDYHNPENPSIFGVASKNKGKWEMDWSYGLDPTEMNFSHKNDYKFAKKIIKTDWGWLDSYMSNFSEWWKKERETIKLAIKEHKYQYDEEFIDSFKAHQKHHIDVYENPTTNELAKVKEHDGIRFFIVPKGKKVIVFTPSASHNYAARKLNFSNNRFDINDFRLHLLVIVKKSDGSMNPINTQVNEIMFKKPKDKNMIKFIKKAANTDWGFVNKYVPEFTNWWNKRIQPALRRNIARWGNEF